MDVSSVLAPDVEQEHRHGWRQSAAGMRLQYEALIEFDFSHDDAILIVAASASRSVFAESRAMEKMASTFDRMVPREEEAE